jgi:acetyl esterase/lipase
LEVFVIMSKLNKQILSEAQINAISLMSIPTEFDSSRIKNKYMNIQYGTLPEQLLDLYLPDEKGAAPFPLIIYVHGGGWSMGTRNFGALEFVSLLLDFGYAVMTVDYRLAPKTVFPEFLFDVKNLCPLGKGQCEKYGINPDKFGIVGDSAGGHLALMMAFTAGHPEYEGEQYGWAGYSSAVQAAVDFYGPSDLAADNKAFLSENGLVRPEEGGRAPVAPLGGAFTTDQNMLKLISPISYVHKDIPPMMLQQGAKDVVVPLQQSTLLAEKITRVCGPDRVRLVVHENLGHSDKGFCSAEVFTDMLNFYEDYLK